MMRLIYLLEGTGLRLIASEPETEPLIGAEGEGAASLRISYDDGVYARRTMLFTNFSAEPQS